MCYFFLNLFVLFLLGDRGNRAHSQIYILLDMSMVR